MDPTMNVTDAADLAALQSYAGQVSAQPPGQSAAPPSPAGMQIGGGMQLPPSGGPSSQPTTPAQYVDRLGRPVAAPVDVTAAAAAPAALAYDPMAVGAVPKIITRDERHKPDSVDPSKLTFARPVQQPAASASQGFTLPGAATSVIPAHNVATVDPAYQRRERELSAQRGQGVLEQGDVAAQGQLSVAAAKGATEEAIRQRADEVEAARVARRQELQPIIDQMAQQARDTASVHMTSPDKRSTWGRVADAVGAGLFAAGQGFLHTGGPNPVLERIHGDIDREVERQKEEYGRKKDAIASAGNIYARVYQLTGDESQARDAARQVGVDAAKEHVDRIAAQSQAPATKQAASLLKNEIDRTDLERKIQENPRVQAQAAGGALAADVARARELRNKAAEAGHDLSPAEGMRQAVLERTGTDLGGGGDLASYAKQLKGAGTTPPLPNMTRASTAYDPSRLVQGTEGAKNAGTQARYNASVMAAMHTKLGIRSPEGMAQVGGAYMVQPGDTQETINRKTRAFAADILVRPDQGPAPGGGETP